MLDDDDIAIETKEYIVSHADYSADELCGIFRKSENRTAVIAIKRISMCDSETALQLVNETLQAGKNGKEISDDQYIAICIGIANYFEETHADAETDRTKNDYIAVLKQIFGQADSVGKKLIKSEKGSKHETRNCGNKKDESHSVSESDCHDLKIT